MFDSILKFFKKFSKEKNTDSKDTAKERLHLVLMQDRANVSADFLELMKQEIIEVIKKYIDVDENLIDVKLTNKINNDGTTGAPALYANIPIVSIKDETRKINVDKQEKTEQSKKDVETKKEEKNSNKEKSAEEKSKGKNIEEKVTEEETTIEKAKRKEEKEIDKDSKPTKETEKESADKKKADQKKQDNSEKNTKAS